MLRARFGDSFAALKWERLLEFEAKRSANPNMEAIGCAIELKARKLRLRVTDARTYNEF